MTVCPRAVSIALPVKVEGARRSGQRSRLTGHGSRTTPYRVRLTVCVLLFIALSPPPAPAHDRTTSYSTWDLHHRTARVTLRLSELDVSRFPWTRTASVADGERLLGEYVTQSLQMLAGTAVCPVTDGPRRLRAPAGRVVLEWQVTCAAAGDLAIRSDVLLDLAPAHLHFARVTRDGTHAHERVLSLAEPLWVLASDAPGQHTVEPGSTTLAGYVALGVEHILSGYDHLAFVCALLLLGGTLRDVVKVVTGFTIAHSLTLGLTVLGYVHPDAAPVEALIGLSIALVAIENVWLAGSRHFGVPLVCAAALAALAVAAAAGYGSVPALTFAGLAVFTLCYFRLLRQVTRTGSVRWAIAFLFGLVHGFGFASVLAEAGLPADRLAAALFGFNIGVELGQLAVVAVTWPLLRWAMQSSLRLRAAVIEGGSAAVLALGMFWFVTRTFG